MTVTSTTSNVNTILPSLDVNTNKLMKVESLHQIMHTKVKACTKVLNRIDGTHTTYTYTYVDYDTATYS